MELKLSKKKIQNRPASSRVLMFCKTDRFVRLRSETADVDGSAKARCPGSSINHHRRGRQSVIRSDRETGRKRGTEIKSAERREHSKSLTEIQLDTASQWHGLTSAVGDRDPDRSACSTPCSCRFMNARWRSACSARSDGRECDQFR